MMDVRSEATFPISRPKRSGVILGAAKGQERDIACSKAGKLVALHIVVCDILIFHITI